jgi:hypothetical protein
VLIGQVKSPNPSVDEDGAHEWLSLPDSNISTFSSTCFRHHLSFLSNTQMVAFFLCHFEKLLQRNLRIGFIAISIVTDGKVVA